MRVGYVNYGGQSGVTPNVVRSLTVLGHRLAQVDPTGVLALRAPGTRLPRPTPRVVLSLAASALRYGPQLIHRRLNTAYAFDQHSRRAGELLEALAEPPDVVLQNGALFAPGRPPRFPYVLLLDNTSLLAERQPRAVEAEMGRHIEFGTAWLARELDTYRQAVAIGTFSELVRQSLIHDYGIEPSRVRVVGAGANVLPNGEPRRADDGRTLVFVGKEWRRKGGPVLLRAFAILRQSRPDLRLLLAGPTESIEAPAGATNLGLVSFGSVEQLLSEATIFVLPTLREPFGIAFLDAMVCKVPCVGTQVGAVPEILGEAGLCVPPADAEALAAAISALLDDPARRAAMGEAGQRRVLQRGYLWPEVGKRLSAILTEATIRERAA